ncbi:hypothetical protein [Psychrilyobacter atlanticus]|uniref:hypothetical protein n=1 Tax=Psychrilyobacter atlanticus TaxID=271091 RepID=UPI00041C5D75|nr:hypothetical protein [Psychrilyobacter atlanticus]
MKLKTKDLIIIGLMGLSLLGYLNEFYISKEKKDLSYKKILLQNKDTNSYFLNGNSYSNQNCC